MLETRVTKLLGVQHPIVMGGMTGVGEYRLAAAVSNAGGLGIFAVHNAGSPQQLRQWIRTIRTLTSKPFGCNLTILPTMGQPPPYMEYARVMIAEGVKIVETAGSNPQPFIDLFKQHGVITIHKCVTIRHALSAQKMGVDIISLDGMECAGHPGEGDVGNLVLQAIGQQALTVPFIASGGIGNGQQLAACLALGADGINLGTRLCVTKESNWPDSFKQRVLDGTEADTILILRKLKNTSRVFGNKVAKQVRDIEAEPDFEFSKVASLVSGKRGRLAEQNNDPDGGIWTAGQVMGLIHDIPTVQELIDRIVKECHETIQQRLFGMVLQSRL